MILVDANLLVYAYTRSFTQHEAARRWLDSQLGGGGPVGLPWVSLVAFLRLVTNPRVFESPASIGDAWRQVANWVSADVAWCPGPTPSHAKVLGELLDKAKPAGALVRDAHLAALAIEHGLTLASTDRDFARFEGLRWQNPLA
jgi:hypothetical protein